MYNKTKALFAFTKSIKIWNLVTKILFLSEKKNRQLTSEGANKSGMVGYFFENNKRGGPFIRDLRVLAETGTQTIL